MRTLLVLVFFLSACATSWSDADTKANEIGVRNEERVLEMCAENVSSECTPSRVRAFTLISYCANARELMVHDKSVDAGGLCRP